MSEEVHKSYLQIIIEFLVVFKTVSFLSKTKLSDCLLGHPNCKSIEYNTKKELA